MDMSFKNCLTFATPFKQPALAKECAEYKKKKKNTARVNDFI